MVVVTGLLAAAFFPFLFVMSVLVSPDPCLIFVLGLFKPVRPACFSAGLFSVCLWMVACGMFSDLFGVLFWVGHIFSPVVLALTTFPLTEIKSVFYESSALCA